MTKNEKSEYREANAITGQHTSVIEISNLEFIWDLVLVI